MEIKNLLKKIKLIPFPGKLEKKEPVTPIPAPPVQPKNKGETK